MAHDLKNSTIFDLTNDSKAIADTLGYETTKEEYIANVVPAQIPIDMLSYADDTGNTELKKELLSVFNDELSLFFNE